MARRQALLLADTGNDRLCLVNLVSKVELRLERRKQAMLRRQMRALHRQQRAHSLAAGRAPGSAPPSDDTEDDSAAEEDDDSDDAGGYYSSSSSSSSEDEASLLSGGRQGRPEDTGPLVGHVETVQVRGLLPEQFDAHFINVPWSPWSNMHAAAASVAATGSSSSSSASSSLSVASVAMTLKQRDSVATSSSSFSSAAASSSSAAAASSSSSAASAAAGAGSSTVASGGAAAGRPTPLTPLPFVHRGQNTFVRKLVVTSQGRIIALNRLGLQCMRWAKDPSMD
jgi:hypothetical protein